MSWLKQSPSSNSLKDSTSKSKISTGQSSGGNSNSNKSSSYRVTRFLACGTVYLTHTLSVPPSIIRPHRESPLDSQAPPTTTSVRAKQVTTQRGGSAVNILSILAQFNAPSRSSSPSPSRTNTVECALVSPLGSDAAGRALMHELELEGIRTRFCKVHAAGVPLAFVLRSDDSPSRTVINHNPLPELTHEDFITILGPILVPEHYHGILTHQWHPHPSLPQPPPVHAVYGPGPGLPPIKTPPPNAQVTNYFPAPPSNVQQPLPPNTPGLPTNAPFTIFHLTGRSPVADAISLMNLTGVDGLARDRQWRDKATFSLDCTAPVGSEDGKEAREKLFPHVDVIFYSKNYALSVNPATPAQKLTPRSFLLSQVPLVAKHALLLVHWEHDGAALLSVPTREYLQCSIWTDVAAVIAAAAPTNVPNASEELTASVSAAAAAMPINDIRPETQLSLGSADPRYREFGTMSSHPDHNAPFGQNNSHRGLPDWSQGREADNATPDAMMMASSPPGGDVMDHMNASVNVDAPGYATFDYGFAEAFGHATPDSAWDYRANRTVVVYDSGDESETDFGATNAASRRNQGLELQTDALRMGTGPSGVIISEGVALSPSDVDSDIDGNTAAMASRFVMEERMRRVYGPLDGDRAESDQLDLTSLDQPHDPNDSDATEDGQQLPGPTRVGKLKKEKMRQREQDIEREQMEQEQEELAFGTADDGGQDFAESIRSQSPSPPKPLPPMPLGVVEAWQAGLLYALSRHVLPGPPYCPSLAPITGPGSGKTGKKPESQEASDWAWKWRLDECLRFAAELSGRRAQKGSMEGLGREMQDGGWI